MTKSKYEFEGESILWIFYCDFLESWKVRPDFECLFYFCTVNVHCLLFQMDNIDGSQQSDYCLILFVGLLYHHA